MCLSASSQLIGSAARATAADDMTSSATGMTILLMRAPALTGRKPCLYKRELHGSRTQVQSQFSHARIFRTHPRPDARDAPLLGSRATSRAVAAALPGVRNPRLLSACGVP